LKEALQVGSERAVASTSQVDGYLANALIRIAIPEQLDSMASTLRKVGLGRQVDELEIGMNRAAERAAADAKSVFWSAIRQMSIADAFAILRGGDHAATDYFRAQTAEILRGRFRPIIAQKMEEVDLSRIYQRAAAAYNAIPLVDKPEAVDLEQYITQQALTGLFTVLAQEEKLIRDDPVARTTDLLRRVFGV
jgi:hypothetical protein